MRSERARKETARCFAALAHSPHYLLPHQLLAIEPRRDRCLLPLLAAALPNCCWPLQPPLPANTSRFVHLTTQPEPTPHRDERDPRWVVQSREDGKNVGGWHWEEKNVLAWSKQQLEELLTAIPAAAAGGPRISALKSCVGEASITTRKGGKRLAIWDLNVILEWVATAEGGDKEVRRFGRSRCCCCWWWWWASAAPRMIEIITSNPQPS